PRITARAATPPPSPPAPLSETGAQHLRPQSSPANVGHRPARAVNSGPVFDSHLSIAGGMHKALLEAERLGLDTVQVFTKNQQQWRVPPLDPGVVAAWTTEMDRLGWRGRTVAHASYLINLASPDDELWAKSIDLMRVEIE